MANEEVKKTTQSKRTTTSKAKVEEQPKQDLMVEQMQQMMAMMMAQQQQMMELIQRTQQLEQKSERVQTEQEELPQQDEQNSERYMPKKIRKEDKLNKPKLRSKYKNRDIYVVNVSQGIVLHHAKNAKYEWQTPGDVEVMTIDDIINMPKTYLNTPWLALDPYENDSDMIDDIVSVLGLTDIYEYIYTLQDMEEDINSVDLEDIKKAIELSRKHGYDITMDMTVLVQRKIRENVLTNYHTIAELSKLLGRKFM